MRFRILRTIAFGVSALLLAGCSDRSSPTGPNVASAPSGTLSLSATVVHTLGWANSHAQTSTTGVIGNQGGMLSIPSADFEITFPAGALPSNTAITIVAIGGNYVVYDMLPHGIRFTKPVTVSQGLLKTKAGLLGDLLGGLKLFGAYIQRDSDLLDNGLAIPTEILPAITSLKLLLGKLVPYRSTWQINHFSRYIMASG
jgi:hypothetical protein